MFCKKVVLRNFSKFTGKHLCQSLFFNKVAGLRHSPATLFSGHLASPACILYINWLRILMFKNTSKWLYLYYLSTQLSFTKLKKFVTYSCDSFIRILIVEYMSSPSKPSVLDKASLTQLSYWNYRNTAMQKNMSLLWYTKDFKEATRKVSFDTWDEILTTIYP